MVVRSHLIKKQILEMHLPNEEGLFHLQEQFSKVCHKKMMPLLDQMFSKLSWDDQYHKFERLEVDVGELTSGDIQNELVYKTLQQLEKVLTKKIKSDNKRQTRVADNFTEGAYQGFSAIDQGVSNIKEISRQQINPNSQELAHSLKQRNLKLLHHYLQQGCLPWWGGDIDITNLCIDMIEQQSNTSLDLQVTISSKSTLLISLAPLLQQNTQACRRLVNLINQKQRLMLADSVSPVIKQWVNALVEYIANVWPKITLNHHILNQAMWAFILNIGARNEFKLISEILNLKNENPQNSVQKNQPEQEISKQVIDRRALYKRNIPEQNISKKIRDTSALVNQAIDYLIKEYSAKNISAQSPSLTDTSQVLPQDQVKVLFTSQFQDEVTENYNIDPEPEEYYIENSGLVLLWPYLSHFFQSLGLINNNVLSDLSMAVSLLHYIETGLLPTSEQNMVLPKVLCGLSVNTVIELPKRLKKQQYLEADAILTAVIEHWSALKSVSVTWLRQVFIHRKGVLKRRNSHWLLHVESSPPDILLEKLPWAISTVKLPWMESLIFVEWSS